MINSRKSALTFHTSPLPSTETTGVPERNTGVCGSISPRNWSRIEMGNMRPSKSVIRAATPPTPAVPTVTCAKNCSLCPGRSGRSLIAFSKMNSCGVSISRGAELSLLTSPSGRRVRSTSSSVPSTNLTPSKPGVASLEYASIIKCRIGFRRAVSLFGSRTLPKSGQTPSVKSLARV